MPTANEQTMRIAHKIGDGKLSWSEATLDGGQPQDVTPSSLSMDRIEGHPITVAMDENGISPLCQGWGKTRAREHG